MSIKPPPVRYLRAAVTGPSPAEQCDPFDPCESPRGSEWRVITRYASNGVPDDCAWVQWASTGAYAREKAMKAMFCLKPNESVVYQTIIRVSYSYREGETQ